MAEKRVRKCAGCKTPHDLHDLGAVSPYCLGRQEDQILPEGQEDESSAVQPGVQDGRENVMTLEGAYAAENSVDDNDSDDAEVLDLQRRLEQLNIQEQNLKKRKILSDLRRQIKENRNNYFISKSHWHWAQILFQIRRYMRIQCSSRLIAIMNLKNSVLV